MPSTVGRLAGKVAIVTGGSMGIGAATVQLLVTHGARVVIADIAVDAGQRLAQTLFGMATFYKCDVSKEEDISSTVRHAEDMFGPLFLFVNNAGISGSGCTLDEMTLADFERTLRINLTSAFLGTKLAARAMKAAGTHGAIVNVASAAGLRGGLSSADYACSKAGMVVLTQQSACELAGDGIRVNSVAPSYVSTPMTAAIMKAGAGGASEVSEEALEASLAAVSAFKGHVATVNDVANAIVFLASPEAAACTGINLLVDTGLLTGIGGRTPSLA